MSAYFFFQTEVCHLRTFDAYFSSFFSFVNFFFPYHQNDLDLGQEDSPEPPPPSGTGDNRQCVFCLMYGDEKANVSQHKDINELSSNFRSPTLLLATFCIYV